MKLKLLYIVGCLVRKSKVTWGRFKVSWGQKSEKTLYHYSKASKSLDSFFALLNHFSISAPNNKLLLYYYKIFQPVAKNVHW